MPPPPRTPQPPQRRLQQREMAVAVTLVWWSVGTGSFSRWCWLFRYSLPTSPRWLAAQTCSGASWAAWHFPGCRASRKSGQDRCACVGVRWFRLLACFPFLERRMEFERRGARRVRPNYPSSGTRRPCVNVDSGIVYQVSSLLCPMFPSSRPLYGFTSNRSSTTALTPL